MTTRAAIYVRISSDPAGLRLGVTRQLSECRKKAKAMGWDVTGVFEDNDVSASTAKVRPAYQRMLSDLEAGHLDAVIVWDIDRLTRRPIEIEHFIDLADRKGIALASVGGDVDLATDNGRLFARIKGAVARAEVERKSARQKLANTQRAEAGRPHVGRRAFGYSSDGMAIVETEARHIRWAAERLLAGGSIRGIVAELGTRGARTTAGGPWRPTEFRRMLANPRYAALRSHNGQVVGPAVWTAILDQDTSNAVRAVLTDPARRRAGRPRRYLLSGLARCAVCGLRCYGTTEKRGPLYYCESRRHIARRAEDIEDLVNETIVAFLSRPDAAAALARPDKSDKAADLRTEERGLRARLDGLAEAFAAGDIDAQQLSAGSKRLRARLSVVGTELATLARTPVLSAILTATDVRATWEALDIDTAREIIGALLTVTLHSPGRGARHFDPDTVSIVWKQD
jgi:site-specific DNA recombinase